MQTPYEPGNNTQFDLHWQSWVEICPPNVKYDMQKQQICERKESSSNGSRKIIQITQDKQLKGGQKSDDR